MSQVRALQLQDDPVDAEGWPPGNPTYGSEPMPGDNDGSGEARMVERDALALLRQRGRSLVVDGRLVQIAAWAARLSAGGRTPGAVAIDAASRRAGHIGPTPSVILITARHLERVSEAAVEEEVRKQIEAVPNSVVLSRYGVGAATGASGRVVALAMAPVELELDPLPRHVSGAGSLHLAGRVAERFERARLSFTRPSGEVVGVDSTGRAFAFDVLPGEAGTYRVELLGEGAGGPVVVANFPVYVDADEPATPVGTTPAVEASLAPSSVEERLLALVNEARARAHLAALVPDSELGALARAHSQDMVDHAFFGHLSPTTGGPDERLGRLTERFARYGENVARAGSAQDAYETLMQSPAHRANVLDARFARVGVGAVVRRQPAGEPVVTVTMVFAGR